MSSTRPLIVPRSIPEEIAAVLQAEIISGGYAAGERLVERAVAERFAVSAIPVREALQQLERRGLVRRRAHHGCSVVQLSPRELESLCELREVLEPAVVGWAAERADAEALRPLEERLRLLEKAAIERNTPEFFVQDLAFHRAIWELSQNSFATSALETAVGSLFACGLRESAGLDLTKEYGKHDRLLAAIGRGRAAEASQTLIEISGDFRRHLRHERKGVSN